MNDINSRVPEYQLEEKEKEIIVTVTAPLSKPKEAALVIEKNHFIFDSPPYHLNLKLPHPVSDRFNKQSYNSETGTYKVKFKKVNASSDDSSSEEDNEFLDLLKAAERDSTDVSSENNEQKQFYGFANKYSNMFGKLYDEFSEVINLPKPDTTSVKDRRKLREEEENEKWSDDHYLADLMETDHLDSVFAYKPPWNSPTPCELTGDEEEMMAEIQTTTKCKDLSEEDRKISELQMIDILYSYAYNKRTTEGDNTVESCWTINKLSSTLSWLEVFEDLKSVILSCYRRSLIYPLYRNWNLCQIIQKDVVNILKNGPVLVTKCLLEVKEIFNDGDNTYVLNTLFINDLCCFAFQIPKTRYIELSDDLEKVVIKKYEVNNDLPYLEVAAHLTLEEEEDEEKSGNCDKNPEANIKAVLEKISRLDLRNRESSESESSSESDTDSDSSQSSDNES